MANENYAGNTYRVQIEFKDTPASIVLTKAVALIAASQVSLAEELAYLKICGVPTAESGLTSPNGTDPEFKECVNPVIPAGAVDCNVYSITRQESRENAVAVRGDPLPTPPVIPKTIRVEPQFTNVGRGNSFQFNVSLTGVTDTSVTWSVAGNAVAGTTIDAATGLLTVDAAETANLIRITATSNEDPLLEDVVAVEVTTAIPQTIAITPAALTIQVGTQQQFTVQLTGVSNTAVTWAVNGASDPGTTIDANGLLTVAAAESSAQFTVDVVSVSVPSLTASATVDVSMVPVAPSIRVTPQTASVAQGGTQQFTATITGLTNTAVNWTITGAQDSATAIDSAGLLTIGAAESAATIGLTAVSVANSTLTDSVVVSVTAIPSVLYAITCSPQGIIVVPSGQNTNVTVEYSGSPMPFPVADQGVTWNIQDATDPTTDIDATGLIHIGSAETNGTIITFRATSTFDPTKRAYFYVKVN